MSHLDYLTRVDRKVLTFSTLEASDRDDTFYWLTKPPIERLMALEVLRQQLYADGATAPRLQRLLEVVEPCESRVEKKQGCKRAHKRYK